MGQEIHHTGKIESINGQHVVVRIVQTSACLHCKIAAHCNSAESKEKLVDVWTRNAEQYAVGQEVDVIMSGKLGLKAVFLAFVLPVIIALAAIMVELQMTATDGPYPMEEPYNQGLGALVGMMTFVVYFVGLYFFRDALKQTFQFRIRY